MKKAQDFLNNFLKANDTIIVACSGGPDSMALLNMLINIKKSIDINVICAHVNHNVRKESDDELLFLKDYCKKKKIPFESMKIQKYGEDNFENEARNIRYDFFDKLMDKYSANYLMTAHHGDDLIETILMRIVRGSTLQGYAGFALVSDKNNYKIVRPLIFTTKKDIEDYNNKNNIPYVIDQTNFMEDHTRNRYRKTVLPFLKNEDKNVHEKFLKYSNTLYMYDSYINKVIKNKIKDIYNKYTIELDKFNKEEELIKIKILYKVLESFYEDDLVLISDSHIKIIFDLIKSRKPNSFIYLPNNIKVIKEYNKLIFKKETDQIDNYEIELTDYVELSSGKKIVKIEESDINNNNYCRLCYDDVVFPLHVRTRKDGDKMVIKNMTGYRKLKDIFMDCKVPLKERDKWPVVVDSKDEIVWLPGLKKSKYDTPKSKKCDIIFKYY